MPRILKLFAPAILLLLPSGLVRADVTGSIFGLVSDRSQGIVRGAVVTATNIDTNFSKQATSGADGQYRMLALAAGRYIVSATAPGFQRFTVSGIVVNVNDQLSVPVTLDVGAVDQRVDVEANSVQVQTESTQLGDVVESKKILALPLNGRSYLDLLGLQAGVVPITSGILPNDRPVSGILANPGNVSISGQRENANAFLVNGGDVSEGKNMGAGLVPNLDSVAEFRLITNSFDAEYGRFSGGVMNAITKSGSNSVHGSVFEFLRNDAMDARNFFDPVKAELRRNQFGYAVGGPFWKNKLFWFTDYQGTRQVVGASTGVVQLPTDLQRTGVFSPSGLTSTVKGVAWANVLSQRLGYTVTNGEQYSSPSCASTANCVFPGGVIPSRAFDKVAVGMLPLIAHGTNPVTGLFTDASQKSTTRDDKTGQRVDLYTQNTGNWSFYYHFDDSSFDNPLNGSTPGYRTTTPSRAQMFTVSNTKTFGAAAVNELRLSAFRTSIFTNKPLTGFADLASLGFQVGSGLGIIPSGPPGYPDILPKTTFNAFNIGVNTLSLYQPSNTYMLSDGFSKVAGRHSMKMGGEMRLLQLNARNICAPTGSFTFNGTETGTDFADFLIGAPASYTQCSVQILDTRSRYGGLYFQDAWKVKPNLTLNMGVRWEVSQPWYDTQGRLNTVLKGVQSTVFPTAPTGYVVPGDPGVPSTVYHTQWDRFSPRLGLAYSPNHTGGVLGKLFGGPGKTSIRAAFGLYYTAQGDLPNFGIFGDAPFGLFYTTPVPTSFATPFQVRSDGSSLGQRFPFTIPIPGDPRNQTLDWSVYLPLLGPGFATDNVLPYAEHYNLTIQRELSKSTVLTLSYVGTQSHHLMSEVDANPASPAKCFDLIARGATPKCGPNGENQVYTLPDGSKVNGTTTNFPYPFFSSRLQWYSTVGNSNYNSLQVTVQRKAADMTFLAAYTYSKAIDGGTADGEYLNPYNYRLSRALSAFDMKHNFVGSYSYAIPFRNAFGNAPRQLTQGWTISGITRFTTGLPVTLSQGSGDLSLIGRANIDMPDVVAPVVIQDARNTDSAGRNIFFSRSSFASPALGNIGNANRRFFYGPGLINTDFGFEKVTQITETIGFQIRAEYFNLFNHAQFNNPIGNFSSGQFGSVRTARPPRIGQISAKFVW